MNPWQKSESDPIDFVDGVWGFWDETWSDFISGWATEEDARDALQEYCETL